MTDLDYDSDEFMRVDIETLHKFMIDVMKGVGVPDDDAVVIADVLIESDKRGIDSHGVGRLKMYYDRIKKGQVLPVTKWTVEKELAGTALIDAHNGMGHVVSKAAMQMAIDKAKTTGIGMVAVGHSNHYGIAGYYSLMAAEQGMIGITGTNARPSIAPTWGVEPLFGTNPLTIALPTDWEFPWCADHATSTTQRGKIETYARLGKALKPGWVINADGETVTDAKQVLVDLNKDLAALTPIGGMGEDHAGYKGYNYAAFVELLSSALQSGSYMKNCLGIKDGKTVPFDLGHFFIAINIEAFLPLDTFKKNAGDVLRVIANSRKAKSAEHIYIAGEKEYLAFLERSKKGVPISRETQKEMQTMIKELNITGYNFPYTL
jgi:LDH2 family malate/lactate/ureidoglycolate dehydrogenase